MFSLSLETTQDFWVPFHSGFLRTLTFFPIIIGCVWCVHGHKSAMRWCVCVCLCVNQRTTLWAHSSPSTVSWRDWTQVVRPDHQVLLSAEWSHWSLRNSLKRNSEGESALLERWAGRRAVWSGHWHLCLSFPGFPTLCALMFGELLRATEVTRSH